MDDDLAPPPQDEVGIVNDNEELDAPPIEDDETELPPVDDDEVLDAPPLESEEAESKMATGEETVEAPPEEGEAEGADEGNGMVEEEEENPAEPDPESGRPAAVEGDRFYRPKLRVQKRNTSKEQLDQALSAPRDKSKRYENRETPFIVGFDITSEAERKKIADRAAKFGTKTFDPITEVSGVSREEYELRKKRLQKFGIKETKDRVMESVHKYETPYDPEVGPPEDYRYDAIHFYGITSAMSTKTIFQYFSGYGATKVEWLNDTACNVVFADTFSCKRALSCLSLPIEGELERVKENNPTYADRPDLEMIVWRKGKACEGHRMLMRVCHKGDVKKPVGERKPSLWYKKKMARFGGRDNRRRNNRGISRGDRNRRIERRPRQQPRGLKINPKSISIKKKKKDKKLDKAADTISSLKIEVDNDESEHVKVEAQMQNDEKSAVVVSEPADDA